MFSYRNSVVQNDLEEICQISFQWSQLINKKILITGANGMIATYLIYALMYQNLKYKFNITIIALSRNGEKSKRLFNEFLNDSHFILLEQDVSIPIDYQGKVDYIYHFAGNSSPYYIKNDPVGIMKSNLFGTFNILELARKQNVRKIILASTREVYGENNIETNLLETSFGSLDCLDGRSCYPESKRAAETLCKSYYIQYNVNFNIARIAHSYGPGMKLDNDGRVMADLISCVVNSRNILLKSRGDALRSFCYVSDTILGLLQILLFGENGEAYNLANETEETSIRLLARMLTMLRPEKQLKIEYQIPDSQFLEYCSYKRVKLNTRKIESLGWKPVIKLKDGIERTVKSFEE